MQSLRKRGDGLDDLRHQLAEAVYDRIQADEALRPLSPGTLAYVRQRDKFEQKQRQEAALRLTLDRAVGRLRADLRTDMVEAA